MRSVEYFIGLAVDEARKNPRAPFGAVIVDNRDGEVVARGHNHTGDGPIWHGEIDAISRAASNVIPSDWHHLHLYTTAEPCCMCQAAILWAGISAVIFGTSIETLKRLGWRQIDIASAEVIDKSPWASCSITGGVLEEECDRLFRIVQS